MGLITKTVKVKWNGKNKKHYVDLGYVYTKIGDEFEVKVEDLQKGSNVNVKCTCDKCGRELIWRYKNYNKYVKENGEIYCNKCSMDLGKLKKTKSFKQWCIENDRQDVLDRWDYDKNNKNPDEIPYGTKKKYWFKCDKHREHKSELKHISSFTSGHNGVMDCKQCNSIAQYILDEFPDKKLEDVWDYKKNDNLNPWNIMHSSAIKVWIKCQEKDYHDSYEVSCSNFSGGGRCSYCRGLKVHPRDSWGQYVADVFGKNFLWKIWASDKNDKSPFEYAPYSNEKVWLRCLDDKHDDYYRTCSDAIYKDFRCPQCSNERKESFGEEKVRLYLEELGYITLHEHNCTIRPINPKTKYPLPYDNEITLDNGERLIIEVHGEQHYNYHFYQSINKCSQEEAEQQLHYQQVKDRYKRIYAIQNGYSYLEIPYTAFDKQETYKKLINDKIKQIKNKIKESA